LSAWVVGSDGASHPKARARSLASLEGDAGAVSEVEKTELKWASSPTPR